MNIDHDPVSLTREILKNRFPNRIILNTREVAEVLVGKIDAASVQSVQRRLERGILIPGLKKQGGRWRIPVQSLIHSIESLATAQAGPYDFDKDIVSPTEDFHYITSSKIRRRRKNTIGPRPGIYSLKIRMEKAQAAMQEVFEHYYELEKKRKEAIIAKRVMPNIEEFKSKDRF